MAIDTDWDDECDVLVVGSGGGALTGAYIAASHELHTLVIEKTGLIGGTTAYSGAGLWLPGNDAEERAGLHDSVDQGRQYFRATVGDRTPRSLQDSYLATGPAMLAELEKHPLLQFFWRSFPDYFAAPGRMPEGRNIFPVDLEASELGDLLSILRPTLPEDREGVEVPRSVLIGGQALLGRLLLALDDTGHAVVRRHTAMDRLVVDNGAVIGAEAATADGRIRIRARRGVLLAAGGFEGSDELRARYQAPLSSAWTNGPRGTNTGEALVAAMDIGAATDLLDECWWSPGTLFPNGSAYFTLGFRGGIIVNGEGRRYMNESLPYDQAGRQMRKGEATGVTHIPSWWVFDSRFGEDPPAIVTTPVDPKACLAAGVWKTADSLAELAELIGVPPGNLQRSVDAFNGYVESGVDEEFHRGEDPYDLFFANGHDGPNPALVAIANPPYFAATMVLSDLGTKGGLRTDDHAHVLRHDDSIIPGLYAAGNTQAAVSGECYPGPGTPIGSCMVFSYLAAHEMVQGH
jgi:3-oxosteroid 1-dehydrogenase